MPDTLKTKKPTNSPTEAQQNLHNTASMTALKHLKPFFWIAVMALICVPPIALIFAYLPLHDVNDFFSFGLCDHVKSAEECDDLITPSYLFWWFIPKPWLFAFISLTAIYLVLKILIEII